MLVPELDDDSSASNISAVSLIPPPPRKPLWSESRPMFESTLIKSKPDYHQSRGLYSTHTISINLTSAQSIDNNVHMFRTKHSHLE